MKPRCQVRPCGGHTLAPDTGSFTVRHALTASSSALLETGSQTHLGDLAGEGAAGTDFSRKSGDPCAGLLAPGFWALCQAPPLTSGVGALGVEGQGRQLGGVEPPWFPLLRRGRVGDRAIGRIGLGPDIQEVVRFKHGFML